MKDCIHSQDQGDLRRAYDKHKSAVTRLGAALREPSPDTHLEISEKEAADVSAWRTCPSNAACRTAPLNQAKSTSKQPASYQGVSRLSDQQNGWKAVFWTAEGKWQDEVFPTGMCMQKAHK